MEKTTKKIETPDVVTCNMRLTGNNKYYWKNQLEDFTSGFSSKEFRAIEFGKQDVRGGFSICFVTIDHCVSRQVFFESKGHMLGYVKGYNEGKQQVK